MRPPLMKRLAERLGLRPVGPLHGDERHPWFEGFRRFGRALPDTLDGVPLAQAGDSGDDARPILFLARGHSGTRALARLLAEAGVHMGNPAAPESLNETWDSLYWAYGFERSLAVRLFRWGRGCLVDPETVVRVGRECRRRHLHGHKGGPWGLKTCGAEFSHPLYRFLFPRARHIRLLRDGRDVMLSHDGRLNLTGATPEHPIWEYYKLITYGLSDDLAASPFPFPRTAEECGPMREHRFWVQAKSWMEHVRMVEHLRRNGELAPAVHTIRYEDLCADPVPVLEGLFEFLELDLAPRVKDFARDMFHTRGIGHWRRDAPPPELAGGGLKALCDFMRPELELCGYKTDFPQEEQP